MSAGGGCRPSCVTCLDSRPPHGVLGPATSHSRYSADLACSLASSHLPTLAPSSELTMALTTAQSNWLKSKFACFSNSRGTIRLKPMIPSTSPSPLPIFSLLDLLFTAISLLLCRCLMGARAGCAMQPHAKLIGRQDTKTAPA